MRFSAMPLEWWCVDSIGIKAPGVTFLNDSANIHSDERRNFYV